MDDSRPSRCPADPHPPETSDRFHRPDLEDPSPTYASWTEPAAPRHKRRLTRHYGRLGRHKRRLGRHKRCLARHFGRLG
ncbi:hypothetical protein GCM10027425_26490 [Alteromonas gracilis]